MEQPGYVTMYKLNKWCNRWVVINVKVLPPLPSLTAAGLAGAGQ